MFLYTNNEKSQREIKETTPCTIASKIIKCLGINVLKETKDLFSENYDADERNLNQHKQMEKIYPILGLEESILLEWLHYLRQSTDSIQSSSNHQ